MTLFFPKGGWCTGDPGGKEVNVSLIGKGCHTCTHTHTHTHTHTYTPTNGDPLGGNLSSCSGYAWPAKRSCHLVVSFCTEPLYRLPASREREREMEEGNSVSKTHMTHGAAWSLMPCSTNKEVLQKQQHLIRSLLHVPPVCVCVCVCVCVRVCVCACVRASHLRVAACFHSS